MSVRVERWGDDLTIRLPGAAVASLHLHEGGQVEVIISRDRLAIRTGRPRYRLEELLSQITPDNQPQPIDVAPVGEELLRRQWSQAVPIVLAVTRGGLSARSCWFWVL